MIENLIDEVVIADQVDETVIEFMTFLQEKFEDSEIYIIGGAVRDMMLGKKPKDWDISIKPADLSKAEIVFDNIEETFEGCTVKLQPLSLLPWPYCRS